MPLDLRPFAPIGLDEPLLHHLIADHDRRIAPELEWLWSYYRNPVSWVGGPAGHRSDSSRPYELAQERGLPARIRRLTRDAGRDATSGRASTTEPVVENDIAWRIDAMVAFIFSKPITIRSTAPDPALRATIERILESAFEASGGMGLLQDAALLGSVHGWVDLIVRVEQLIDAGWQLGAGASLTDADLAELARLIRIELIEAPRSIPILAESDYRILDGYIIRASREGRRTLPSAPPPRTGLTRWIAPAPRTRPQTTREVNDILEILSPHHRQVYIDGALAEESPSHLGTLPIVHIQNASQPFRYAGLSEVEPLIPLQDELNARLSDRAHRVTMQSFNMYLAKGLESLSEGAASGAMRIGPGQVWSTDNTEADVKSFGGDGHSPSEERHIDEVREAMDKASSVSPVVLGVVRAKLGHLSSVNALRITMLGVLTKTERKRLAYGRGIAGACSLILRALDIAGLLHTSESDRAIRIEWPDPLPASEEDRLATARVKRDIGVPTDTVLRELGYALRSDAVD